MTFPTPQELGLPRQYKNWRPNQVQAIKDGIDAPTRFVLQVQRQGEGKTVTYISQGLADNSKRYIYLTSTKGLQDQLLAKFGSIGLVDIRGKATYNCEGMPGHTCAEGSVAKCVYKGSSLCGHSAAKQEANTARLVTSNYSCWMASNKYGQGFGKFDVMVCDEAHNLPAELSKALQVTLGEREICEDLQREWPDMRSRKDMESWKHWALVSRSIADSELQRLKIDIEKAGKSRCAKLAKEYQHYTNLVRKLADIATCRPEHWVVDTWAHGYQFDPLEPADYAERTLFRGIERVIFTTGTANYRKLGEQLGIDQNDFGYYEYPSNVDPARTPIMYIPTAKVNYNAQPWELRRMVARIDEIFESRPDRKGIIHTSSGRMRDFIMANSQYSRFFVSNYAKDGDLISTVVEQFNKMQAPAVLVSPSVTTGYDFPYDLCRYQIIAKLNFPNSTSAVEKARVALDPQRSSYHAIVSLQQAATRGDRADDDFQEVFILDDAFPSLLAYNRDLFNPSFLACVKTFKKVPKAPLLAA